MGVRGSDYATLVAMSWRQDERGRVSSEGWDASWGILLEGLLATVGMCSRLELVTYISVPGFQEVGVRLRAGEEGPG